MSLCFCFYKRKDSLLILTQHKIPSQIHIINNIRSSVQLHSLCFLLPSALASFHCLQDKRHINCSLDPTHPISKKNTPRNFMKQSSMTYDLLWNLFIPFPLCSYKQKQPKTIDKTFSISHMALLSNQLPP